MVVNIEGFSLGISVGLSIWDPLREGVQLNVFVCLCEFILAKWIYSVRYMRSFACLQVICCSTAISRRICVACSRTKPTNLIGREVMEPRPALARGQMLTTAQVERQVGIFLQYRLLIPSPVDRTGVPGGTKNLWITCQKISQVNLSYVQV